MGCGELGQRGGNSEVGLIEGDLLMTGELVGVFQ